MKRKRQFSLWFKIRFYLMLHKHSYLQKIREARKYNFLWIWRFLLTWGWNGEKNTFSVSFYKSDLETQVWSVGDY